MAVLTFAEEEVRVSNSRAHYSATVALEVPNMLHDPHLILREGFVGCFNTRVPLVCCYYALRSLSLQYVIQFSLAVP